MAEPVNVEPPELVGTPAVGQTLTVTDGVWGDPTDLGFDYEWYRHFESPGAPINTVLPSVSGTPAVDQVLVVTNGTWTGSPTFSYEWYRRTEGPPPINEAPDNVTLPVVSGITEIGQILHATGGIWTGVPTPTLGYEWFRRTEGVPISPVPPGPWSIDDPYKYGGLRVWDDYQFLSRRCGPSGAQPRIEIKSPDVVFVPDEQALRHPLVTNWKDPRRFLWSIVGGIDAAHFEVVQDFPWILRWVGDGVRDFEAPTDSNHNNIYEVTVRVRDSTGPYGTDTQPIRVHVLFTGIVSDVDVAPFNIEAPVATGVVATDGVLSCTTGVWGGSPVIIYTYQWFTVSAAAGDSNLLLVGGGELLLVDGVSRLLLAEGSGTTTEELIPGATSNTYTVPAGLATESFYCRVTGTNSVGFASANSNILEPSGIDEEEMPPPTAVITDLHQIGPFLGQVAATNAGTVLLRTQLWLGWTPIPGSKGTVLYRSRLTGTLPRFTNWEATRIGYPGNEYRDGAEGPLDSGREYSYQACAYYDNGEGPLSTPPVTAKTYISWNNGYQALMVCHPASDIADQGHVSDYTAAYTLATAPAQWEGNNIYYFISTQSIYFNAPAGYQMSLVQPVVAYGSWGDALNPEQGGDYWWMANWFIDRGRYFVGPAMAVPVGVTSVTGKIVRNSALDYTSKFVEYPALDLNLSGMQYEARVCMVGYEYYSGSDGIPDWTYHPGDMVFQIINCSLSIQGSGIPMLYSYTRSPLSGTSRNVLNNGTATPTVIFTLQHNNDWVPVNM